MTRTNTVQGESPVTTNPHTGAGQIVYESRSNARYIHPNGQSRYAMVKESWGNPYNFMLSYGLKHYNHDDYDTAKQIQNQMLELDWGAYSQNQAQSRCCWNHIHSPERSVTPNDYQLPRDQQYSDSVYGDDWQERVGHGSHVAEDSGYGGGNRGYHSDDTNSYHHASETTGFLVAGSINDNHFSVYEYSVSGQDGGEQGGKVEGDKEGGEEESEEGSEDGSEDGSEESSEEGSEKGSNVGSELEEPEICEDHSDGSGASDTQVEDDGAYDSGDDDGYDGGYDDGYDDDGYYDDGYSDDDY